jgi:hypothetical protein
LIDEKVVIDDDWNKYLHNLNCEIEQPHILYPVAVTDCAFKLNSNIPEKINGNILETNFIRLYEIEANQRVEHLVITLAQELCRLLYHRKRLADSTNELSPAPIKLFLSHAKNDGEKLIKKLKHYIQDKLRVDTFFDARDIAMGFKFPSEIDENIKQSILLALHTDAYSTREWCRKEIIKAKKHNCPVIVINAFEEGEKRSFPYMANVPNIKWDLKTRAPMKKIFHKLFFQVILESLRFRYHKENIKYLLSIFGIKLEDQNILEYPPELFTFHKLKSLDEKIVVYPDPPLGDVELEILNEFEPGVRFITPTVLPLIKSADEKFLSGIRVAVSISEYPESFKYGFELMHFQDALVEFARYLLKCGAALVYGGNVRYDKDLNFAQLLFDLARTYSIEQKEMPKRIRNYVAYPIYLNISDKEKANLKEITKFEEIEPPADLKIKNSRENILKDESVQNRYIGARCLTWMRERMNEDSHARILLGGKTINFKGKYPGLFEEAYLALKDRKPVYLIGAFGGCTRAIIDAIEGKSPVVEFTETYQSQAQGYADFIQYYNKEIVNVAGGEPINYPQLLKFFNEIKIEGLNNGLAPEENHILFETSSVPEMIGLVLKGLKNHSNPKRASS